MAFEILQHVNPLGTVIKVIGVGGGGGNAIDHMISRGAQGVEFIAANTDHQALTRSQASVRIQLGSTGLGAGSRPEVGAAAALEKRDEIIEAIRGTHLLFITAGMGGGTGTGAAPVIAELAKELGILTVGVVTKPFSFEGARRMRIAQKGIDNLRDKVDSLIVILNEKLESTTPPDATMKQCFEISNDVLYKACVGIPDIINTPGVINVDFEDLRTVMSQRGTAIIGLASASGENRVRRAAEEAINCPLLEGTNLQSARGLLVYFTGDDSLTLAEVREAMGVLNTFVHKSADIIFGSAITPDMGNEVRVTLVATGLDQTDPNQPDIQVPVMTPPATTRNEPPTLGDAPAAATPADKPAQPAAPEVPAFEIPPFLNN